MGPPGTSPTGGQIPTTAPRVVTLRTAYSSGGLILSGTISNAPRLDGSSARNEVCEGCYHVIIANKLIG